MERLIDAQIASPRKPHLREQSPGLTPDSLTLHLQLLHSRSKLCKIISHQVELVDVVLIGWMKGKFGGRKAKDRPTVSNVNVWKLQNVPEEGTICFGILAVDD